MFAAARHWFRSLRIQLLSWVVLTMALAIAVNLYLSFRSAESTAELVTDHTLLASARAIAEAVRVDEGGSVVADTPPAALEMFDTGFGDRVYFQVITAFGTLVAGYSDLPQPDHEGIGEDIVFRDEPLRVLMLSHPLVGLGENAAISVTVGVTHGGQYAMRRHIWLSDFSKQLFLLLVAGCMTIFGLHQGLKPMMRLRNAVRSREQLRLDPISPDIVQTELKPLVQALNDHMQRVRNQMAAQRRFVANAAHQLRTPLALLTTQASVAAREADDSLRAEALRALTVSTRQLSRLASQLLTLSRAEPGSRRPRSDRINLAAAARQVLEAHAEQALQGGIDLGLEADMPVHVQGDGTMLREMIVNLVDNALRYTPSGGAVTVRVLREGHEAVLTVEDNGPGIPDAEKIQVFERFYRIMGTGSDGSGLGLAIVREVIEAAGGSIDLLDVPSGGLVVSIRLQAGDS